MTIQDQGSSSSAAVAGLKGESTAHPLPISAIVITKDEGIGIGSCLAALADFSEVFVVDSESTDGTAQLASEAGANVVPFRWNGTYPKKKQWCLDNLPFKNKWVLLLDADEQPTAGLVQELQQRLPELESGTYAAYDIPIEYVFAGRSLKHGHTVVKRSLVDPLRTHFPAVGDLDAPGIKEVEGHYQPVPNGPVGQIRSRIRHNDRDPLSTWFSRHNRYSDWEAYLRTHPDLHAEVAHLRSRQGRIFARMPAKSAIFFLYAYVARGGFLDGRPGLDYALALTFYYWQISLKVREIEASGSRRADRGARK